MSIEIIDNEKWVQYGITLDENQWNTLEKFIPEMNKIKYTGQVLMSNGVHLIFTRGWVTA